MSKQVDKMWLQEQNTDNGWIASQIRSYNTRLADFIVGGNRAPKLSDMEQWQKDILAVRKKWAGKHKAHTMNSSDFGCKHCRVAGW